MDSESMSSESDDSLTTPASLHSFRGKGRFGSGTFRRPLPSPSSSLSAAAGAWVDVHFDIRKEMYLRFCGLEEQGELDHEQAQMLRALIYPTSERFEDFKFVYLVNKDLPASQLIRRLLELAPVEPKQLQSEANPNPEPVATNALSKSPPVPVPVLVACSSPEEKTVKNESKAERDVLGFSPVVSAVSYNANRTA
jgi:hypothetical protein